MAADPAPRLWKRLTSGDTQSQERKAGAAGAPEAGALLAAKLTAAAGGRLQGSQQPATIKAFVLPTTSPAPPARRPGLPQLAVALQRSPGGGGINSPRAGAELTVLQPRRPPPPPPLISLDDEEQKGGSSPGGSPGSRAALAQWQQRRPQQRRGSAAKPAAAPQPQPQAYSFTRLA